jgi:hypothetical protein
LGIDHLHPISFQDTRFFNVELFAHCRDSGLCRFMFGGALFGGTLQTAQAIGDDFRPQHYPFDGQPNRLIQPCCLDRAERLAPF